MSLEQRAREMLERATENLSPTELVLDNSNKIGFPGYPYLFEALGKKIIVSIDIFKSGYECKVCKGRKKTETICVCETYDHPGLRYSNEEIATIRENLGSDVSDARAALPCPECKGDYISMRRVETCTACKGLGAVLILPETSRNLPTSGVVVSIGNRVNLEKLGYKVGDRILFGPYAGSMIPTKAGLLFKILDWNSAWCRVEGADELGAFDFVLQDENG